LGVMSCRGGVSPRLDGLVAGSRSMALADSAKARATLALAGFLTAAAANAGFSPSGWLLGADALPLGDRPRRPDAWESIRFEHRSSPVAAGGGGPAPGGPRRGPGAVGRPLGGAGPAAGVR